MLFSQKATRTSRPARSRRTSSTTAWVTAEDRGSALPCAVIISAVLIPESLRSCPP